ncbi:MAG: glycosyltransferase family 4 protein [Victivallaceae bacterium]|nr:glycosyltransferase family 4 protein [Victivallaceae bacterium]
MKPRPLFKSNGDPVPVAVLLSGTGSNARALLEYERSHADCSYHAVVIITDRPESNAEEIASKYEVECVLLDIRRFYQEHGEDSIRLDTEHRRYLRDKWSKLLLAELRRRGARVAMLAGFVPLTNIAESIPCLNVHPGDLTKVDGTGRRVFAGLHLGPVERAIVSGCASLRSSVILVQPYHGDGKDDVDGGPVLGISGEVPVELSGHSVPELSGIFSSRVGSKCDDALRRLAKDNVEFLKISGDHVVFPQVADAFCHGRYSMAGGRLYYDGEPVGAVEFTNSGAKPLPPSLNICHVITRMIVGGAQENTLLTIRGHREKGHRCLLVTGPCAGREGQLLGSSEQDMCEVRTIPSLVRELSPVNDVVAFFQLYRLFCSGNFDVVHTHSSKAGILGRLAARLAGVPVVVHTVHGQPFSPYCSAWRNSLYVFAEKIAAMCSDRIFAVAQAMVDQCIDNRIANIGLYRVVYSGMDIESLAAARRDTGLRRKLGIPDEAKVVVCVARLQPLKGYEYVLEAFSRIASTSDDVHCLIVGDGELREKILETAERGGFSNRIHLAGLVSPRDVPAYLVQGDLLWHLSLREGLPRAVVQALFAGLPVISWRVDGAPEIVSDGESGYVLDVGDVNGVVERTRGLFDDDARRMRFADNGRRQTPRVFDWRIMSDILENAYLELLGKRTD